MCVHPSHRGLLSLSSCSRRLCPLCLQALSIKAQLASGEIEFSEAAMQFNTDATAQKGGKLGKFTPGTLVPEIDAIVFDVTDTGEMNLANGANLYEATYPLNEVHGPVKSKLGYHLIKIDKRVIADFDFRAKEGQLPKANVWDDVSSK